MPDPQSPPHLADAVIGLGNDVRRELDGALIRMVDSGRDPQETARRFRQGLDVLHGVLDGDIDGGLPSPLLTAADAVVTATGRLDLTSLAAEAGEPVDTLRESAWSGPAGMPMATFEQGILAHNRVAATAELRDLLATPRHDPATRLVIDAAQKRRASRAADVTAAERTAESDNYRWSTGTRNTAIVGATFTGTGIGIGAIGLLTMLQPEPGIAVTLAAGAVTVAAAVKGLVTGERRQRHARHADRDARQKRAESQAAYAELFDPRAPRTMEAPPTGRRGGRHR